MNELLAKGAIEASIGGAGFYSNIFVFPKQVGGLLLILNLKQFNHYMLICTFKMPSIKQVWILIQRGDYAFSIDNKDSYLFIPVVKHHHYFNHTMEGVSFSAGHSPKGFHLTH